MDGKTRRQKLVAEVAESMEDTFEGNYWGPVDPEWCVGVAGEIVDRLDDAGWLRREPVQSRGDGPN